MESSLKLSQYRRGVLKQQLREKLNQKRLELCSETEGKIPLERFIKDQYFTVKDQRICQHFEDYELTKIAFKSKTSYMAVQDRRGFIIVKDDKVLQMKRTGKKYTF